MVRKKDSHSGVWGYASKIMKKEQERHRKAYVLQHINCLDKKCAPSEIGPELRLTGGRESISRLVGLLVKFRYYFGNLLTCIKKCLIFANADRIAEPGHGQRGGVGIYRHAAWHAKT